MNKELETSTPETEQPDTSNSDTLTETEDTKSSDIVKPDEPDAVVVEAGRPDYLDPKYTSIEEQAKAYLEAQKLIGKTANEASELKRQLSESKKVLEKLGYSDELSALKGTLEGHKASELQHLESIYQKDLADIKNLFENGSITELQANELFEKVLERKAEVKSEIKSRYENQSVEMVRTVNNGILSRFVGENPDFFGFDSETQTAKNAHRWDLIAEFEKRVGVITSDDLNAIKALVDTERKIAVDEYIKGIERNKSVATQNSELKDRLGTTVTPSGSTVSGKKIFTTEEIRKMSSDEFGKHEKEIFAQMAKGLIK